MGIAVIPAASGGATLAEITASLPSLSQINTSVTNNSASSPNWVLIGSNTTHTSTVTRTISSIPSTYRRLRIIASGLNHPTSSHQPQFRINGDVNQRYSAYGYNWTSSNQSVQSIRRQQDNSIQPMLTSVATGQKYYFDLVIENYASNSSLKFGSFSSASNNGSYSYWTNGNFVYSDGSTTTVSSVSLIDSAGTGYITDANAHEGLFVFGAL